MTLVKVNRPRTLRTFDDMLSNFFDEVGNLNARPNVWRPQMDAQEMEKSFELSFALPGFEKEDITLSVKSNILTLKAAKSEIKEETNQQYLVREIARGSYERSIELPENVSSDKISAEYKSGILTLSIPKTKEALPREIAVTVK